MKHFLVPSLIEPTNAKVKFGRLKLSGLGLRLDDVNSGTGDIGVFAIGYYGFACSV